MKIGQKIILGMGGILLLTTSVTVGVLVVKQDRATHESSSKLQETILRFGVGKLEVALGSDRMAVVKSTIKAMVQFEILHGLIVFDGDGDTLFSSNRNGESFALARHIQKSLVAGSHVNVDGRDYYSRRILDAEGEVIARIVVCFDASSVEEQARSDVWTAVLMGGLVFGLAMLVVPILMRRITGPLTELRDRIWDITEGGGDLTSRVEVTTSDEVGELATAFNTFVATLRSMLIEVRSATEKIGEESRAIDQGSQAIHHQAEEQEQSITDVRGVVDSLASAVHKTGVATGQVDELSQVSRQQAEQGVSRIRAFVETMDEIRASNQQISEAMEKVNAIAFQTNLLALNAAVEAARAGRDGSGFVVVAEEVRSLASRSSETATGIGEVIKRSTTSTERAATSLAELRETLELIAESSNEINERLTTVNTAVREQIHQVEEVSGCFEGVKSLAQDSSRNTVHLATQSERTASEVATLNELLAQFRL